MLSKASRRLTIDCSEGNTLTSLSETSGPDFENDHTLVPAIAQDLASGKVLMLAYMNRTAWEQTLASGEAVYYSRSRGRLWKKGEQSGNVQKVREVYVDCDADTVLLKVEQLGGAACHQGYESCFFRQRVGNDLNIVAERVFDPQQVYDKK
jgi:phosphoribosyl-AMP cyclohydrolase